MSTFKKFEDARSQYEARITELNTTLEAAHNELEGLQVTREDILRDIMADGDVTALEARIEATEKLIKQTTERINYAEEYKRQQLSAMLPDLEKERQKAILQKEEEYNQAIRDLNRQKMEFLNSAARIGGLANEIDKINEQSNKYRLNAGEEKLKHWPFQSTMTLNASPAMKGFDVASWETLAIPEWLVRPALQDNVLPRWNKEVLAQ
ncbi:hypothetical protein [Paenibacillus xylanexedens]|uniref:hypothetical protein n=1 Tax=Paenibacillus xylanexedens TaxID=528191 RepID=UPI000F5250A4|nr:hypothetical protein [Paenibacillus xylanexedens]RPK16429.1 hypothetical protein EDO6_03090 [Paenibacillus xylanexedens]